MSSLSFTDIYGLSTTTPADPAMLDLHRRVEKILSQGGMSPSKQSHSASTPQIQTPHRQSITELTSIEEVASPTPSIVEQLQQSSMQLDTESTSTNYHHSSSSQQPQSEEHRFLHSASGGHPHHQQTQQQPLSPQSQPQQNQRQQQQLQMPSQLSLSPRSSLSSVSPPISPHVDYLLQYASGAMPKHSHSPNQSSSAVPQRQNANSYSRLASSSDYGSASKANNSSAKPSGLVLECNNQSASSSSSIPSPSSPSLCRKNLTSYGNSTSAQVGSSGGSSNVCEGLSPICERRTLESSSSAISNSLPSSSNASNVRSSVVSVAASDESVAGDSGVFEAASPAKQPNSQRHHRISSTSHQPNAVINDSANSQINVVDSVGIRETAQVLIRLKYSVADSLLYVGVEKARNLQALLVNASYPLSESSRKICIKGSLLPPVATTGWIFQTSAIGSEDNERNGSSLLNKVSFGQSFALAVPKTCVDSKTLLLTIWSVWSRKDREDDEECLGSTQLSLADKDLFGTSAPITPCWYNVLNFHFVMGGVNNSKPSLNLNAQSRLSISSNPDEVKNTLGDKSAVHQLQQTAYSTKPESQMSSRQGTLKEGESSDDSTIISSQTSTLTRTIDPEMLLSSSNLNLKSSSSHSIISQLAGSELRANCLYSPFTPPALNSNNLSYQSTNAAASESPVTQSNDKRLSKLGTNGEPKVISNVTASSASSSSISSGPQQGSRQSTPFNTTLEKGNKDGVDALHVNQSGSHNKSRPGLSLHGSNSNKPKKVKEQLLSEEVVASLVQKSPLVDAQTNTECVFLSPSAASNSINSRGKPLTPTMNSNTGLTVPSNENNSVSALVRRSQTFTPSAPINKNDYVCKVSYYRSTFFTILPPSKGIQIYR